jgi:hypothetical protein
METPLLDQASRLSNQQLIARVRQLAQHGREVTAGLVASLAELDARKLHLGLGCASVFTYCTEVLHFSEHEAYLRINAARLARRFPLVLDKLESGAVNLTTLKLLRKLLTPENHGRLLAAVEHKSKRQLEELVASIAPQAAVKASIRKVAAATVQSTSAATMQSAPAATGVVALALEAAPSTAPAATPIATPTTAPVSALRLDCTTAAGPAEAEAKPAIIAPLAPERYKIQFTASAETHAKLRRAQDLMRHQIPTGDPAAIIDRALTLLVAHLEKTRLGATSRPRAARPTRRGSRHIPAAVRRTTWERDGGRCAFVGADGKRCTERGFFQFHHVHPHGDGGEPTSTNIELRCRAHNQYEADVYFGPSNDAARKAGIQKRARKRRAMAPRKEVRVNAADENVAPADRNERWADGNSRAGGNTFVRESPSAYGALRRAGRDERRGSLTILERRDSVQTEFEWRHFRPRLERHFAA